MTRPLAPWESTPGRRAARQYLSMARELRRLAYQAAADDKPLTARKHRYYARMAEHAAEAETAPQENLP